MPEYANIHAKDLKVPQPFYQISYSLQTTIDDYNEISRLLRFEKGVQHTTDYLLSNPLPQAELLNYKLSKSYKTYDYTTLRIKFLI